MGTTSQLINLTSRVLRQETVKGGVRVVKAKLGSGEEGNGFWNFVVSAASSVLGTIFKAFSWTFTSLWSLIVAATSFVMNFNWNITDQEIDQQIKQAINSVAGLLGQEVGKTLGYIVCGAVPTAAVFVINPTVAKSIAPQITEELLGNLASSYAIAIQQTGRLFLQAGALSLYASVRRAFRGSDNDLKNRLKASGANEEAIKKEIEARNKPFILSQKIQESIDSISNQTLKALVDQAYQEFGSSCIEAGYVVAGGIDNYAYHRQLLENETVVEIDFNGDGSYEVKPIPIRPAT